MRFLVMVLVGLVLGCGDEALHDAAAGAHLSVVVFLVGAGAEVGARDRWGDTPRDLAVVEGHTAIVSYFDFL